jgi:hypothetical protein
MAFAPKALSLLAAAAIFVLQGEAPATAPLVVEQAEVTLCSQPAPPPSSSVCGFSLIAQKEGPQIAVMGRSEFIVSVRRGEDVCVAIPVSGFTGPLTIEAEAMLIEGEAEAALSLDGTSERRTLLKPGTPSLEITSDGYGQAASVRLKTRGTSGEAAVRWRRISLHTSGQPFALDHAKGIPWPGPKREDTGPPLSLPDLRPPIERALIEWDWRMQDGIATERNPSTYAAAIARTLKRGDDLIRDLQAAGAATDRDTRPWEDLRNEWKDRSAQREARPQTAEGPEWESLWRRVHLLRRNIALHNPAAGVGPLLFVKQVPSCFSHQLTQYYGSCAKPGGGVFVLDAPGTSMRCRPLAAGALPVGSYQHPEVSFDGKRVLFSYCRAETAPPNRETYLDRFYHLYEMAADGSGLRQLTDGPFDDFAPRYLPDGKIMFISTRRGGFHRCGRGPCPTYTLAIADADGANPHPVSYHETHEWDPCLLNDGRVIYTRWDYVDRHAVHYENLWTVRPDGTDARAFYGNNTFTRWACGKPAPCRDPVASWLPPPLTMP